MFFPKTSADIIQAAAMFAAMFLFGLQSLSAQDQACSIAQKALRDARAIRGLTQSREVPCLSQSKKKVKEFLLTTLKEEIPPERLAQEELVWKAFGVISEDYNYQKGLIDLYLSQLGGYYDPKLKRFVMAAWLPFYMQTPVAVHELTHALQDQHYDLEKFLDSDRFSTDELLARSALVEGDATAVMIDHSNRLIGQPALAKTHSVNNFMLQNVVGAAMLAGSQGVPLGVQLVLVFPYTSGLRFVHQQLLDGGYRSVDKAFKNPPRSTEEVLHPEKYFEVTPDFVRFSDDDVINAFPDIKGEIEYSDTFGEFVVSVVLASHLQNHNQAALAAAGWGGDRLLVVKVDAQSQDRLVLWKINWDSEEHAKKFIEALVKAWRYRYQSKSLQLSTGSWQELPNSQRLYLAREKTVVKIGISALSEGSKKLPASKGQ